MRPFLATIVQQEVMESFLGLKGLELGLLVPDLRHQGLHGNVGGEIVGGISGHGEEQ